MTLFWHETGPLLRYRDGTLEVEDLNPQVQTRWSMSRSEMFMTGIKFILAALTGG